MEKQSGVLQNRKISTAQAKQCANEQVQFIGKIQPHGFVIVVDDNNKIVQYSKNFLSLVNQTIKPALAANTRILQSSLLDWISYDESCFKELLIGQTQVVLFDEGGKISPVYWECIAALVDEYILLEFFPNSKKQDSYHLINNLDRMVSRVRASSSLEEFFKTVTDEFQKHTEYDRVMIYKFHPDWSGEVISETVSDRTNVEFIGLRFPSDDIPQKARELYNNSMLRIMADVDAKPVDLVPKLLPSGKKLDQSIGVLRAMSLMHIKYLKNMGVKASMSIALKSQGKLWGLMAFHHYTSKIPPNHLVSEMKVSCELFADIITSYLNPAIDLERLRKNLIKKHEIENVFRTLEIQDDTIHQCQELLNEICPQLNYDYVGISYAEKCFVFSKNTVWIPKKDLSKKLTRLLKKSKGFVFESDRLLEDKTPFVLSSSQNIAGILISKGKSVEDLYIFYGANEVEKTIKWAGEPNTINIVD